MARPKGKPTRLSQGVVRKQRPAVDIEESARTNAPKVASDLEPFLLRGLPEGQTLPDLVLLQVTLGNVVRADAEAMEAADEAHFEEVSRYNKMRKQRDETRDRLFPALGNLRDNWDASYGPNDCQSTLGLGINLPSESLRLRRLGSRVIRMLSAPGLELPAVETGSPGIEAETWIATLTPDVDGLRETMNQMSEIGREVERKLMAKTLAVETYEESLVRGSQVLEVFYKVSGNEPFARRLRPSIRKARRAAREGGEGDGSKAEGSAPEASAAAEAGGPSASASEPTADDAGDADDSDSDAAPDRPPAGGQAAQGDGAQPSQTASAGP